MGRRRAEQFHLSSAARVEAAGRLAGANAEELYDRQLFIQYMVSNLDGKSAAAAYLQSLFRPEAKRVIDQWLTMPAAKRRGLRTPFALKEYSPPDRASAAKLNETAGRLFDLALHARQRSDRYILLTVLFASVSFLGGISTKLSSSFHLNYRKLWGHRLVWSGDPTNLLSSRLAHWRLRGKRLDEDPTAAGQSGRLTSRRPGAVSTNALLATLHL